jgi:hypothetical protein
MKAIEDKLRLEYKWFLDDHEKIGDRVAEIQRLNKQAL